MISQFFIYSRTNFAKIEVVRLILYYIVCILEKKFSSSVCKNMTNGGSFNQDDVDTVQKSVADLEIYDLILQVLQVRVFVSILTWDGGVQ